MSGQVVRFSAPEEPGAFAPIKPGEIRAARPMSADSGSWRLVLLLDCHEEPDSWANAALISNLIETATDRDVAISTSESGLRFEVLVQTDVVGPLFAAQLGPSIGTVRPELMRELQRAVLDEPLGSLRERVGVPLMSPQDPRWRLKTEEVVQMHVLAGDCLDHLMAWASGVQTRLLVDSSIFVHMADRRDLFADVIAATQRRGGGAIPEVPIERDHESEFIAWLSTLHGDEARMAQPLVNGTLTRAALKRVDTSDRAVRWTPPLASPVSQGLTQQLVARALSGTRAIRILSPYVTGVFGLDVADAGRLQVAPPSVASVR